MKKCIVLLGIAALLTLFALPAVSQELHLALEQSALARYRPL